MTHWLQKQIYPYILDNKEEKEFRRTFLREELLRIFQAGQRRIQLGYRFRKGKYITYYTVNIEMFEHRWLTPLNVVQSGKMKRFRILAV